MPAEYTWRVSKDDYGRVVIAYSVAGARWTPQTTWSNPENARGMGLAIQEFFAKEVLGGSR